MNYKSITFTSFTQILLSSLQEKLGGDYKLFAHIVKKNNGVELTGIVAGKKGCNASPTIYINEYYREGMTEEEIDGIAEMLYENFREAEFKEDLDLSDFLDYQIAGKRLAVKLINAEKNRELLPQVPHKLFHNLALVAYYPVQEVPFEGKAVILIHHTHRKMWQVDEETLINDAIKNTPKLFPGKIESMNNVMKKMIREQLGDGFDKEELRKMGISDEEWLEALTKQDEESCQGTIPMFVLSNSQKLYGAVCMLYPNILKKFCSKIKKDCYILPSSVHEVILVPADAIADEGALREIVTDINRTQVAEDEVLADCIYYYSRSKDDILMI